MAQSVVHELEAIEVEEHHCGRGVVPTGAADRLLEPIQEQQPVGQPRQRVVERLVLERGLDSLALGEVSSVDDDAGHRGSVDEVRDDRLDVAPRPVGVADSQLERLRGRHDAELSTQLDAQPGDVIRMDEPGSLLADEVLWGSSEEVEARLARIPDLAGRVHHDGEVGRVLHERPEPVLARAQLRFGGFLLVHHGSGHSHHDHDTERLERGEAVDERLLDQRRRDATPDRQLTDPEPQDGPPRGDAPRLRAAPGDVLLGHERVGDGEHRTPPGDVERGGDDCRLHEHADVDRGARRLTTEPDLAGRTHQRAAPQHQEVHPQGLGSHHVQPPQRPEHRERQRVDRVGEDERPKHRRAARGLGRNVGRDVG